MFGGPPRGTLWLNVRPFLVDLKEVLPSVYNYTIYSSTTIYLKDLRLECWTVGAGAVVVVVVSGAAVVVVDVVVVAVVVG